MQTCLTHIHLAWARQQLRNLNWGQFSKVSPPMSPRVSTVLSPNIKFPVFLWLTSCRHLNSLSGCEEDRRGFRQCRPDDGRILLYHYASQLTNYLAWDLCCEGWWLTLYAKCCVHCKSLTLTTQNLQIMLFKARQNQTRRWFARLEGRRMQGTGYCKCS